MKFCCLLFHLFLNKNAIYTDIHLESIQCFKGKSHEEAIAIDPKKIRLKKQFRFTERGSQKIKI